MNRFFSAFLFLVCGAASVTVGVFIATQFAKPAKSQTDPFQAPGKVTAKVPAKADEAVSLDNETALDGTPVPQASPPAAAAPSGNQVNLLEGIIEGFDYSPEGKRDPFQAYSPAKSVQSDVSLGPQLPLQRFDLDQLKIAAIIWDVPQPKAMVTDPTGKGHILSLNERVGKNSGYVAAIREGEIVVIEAFDLNGKTNYQTRILRLQRE